MRDNNRFKRNIPNDSHQVNDRIRASQVRLITETGENVGVVPKSEALSRAREAGLDLVKIGDQGDIVIAKIMDFGKYLYQKKKKEGEAKKKQKVIQIKEIKMRPNIGDQDYETKFKRAVEFLKDGKRVKFTLQFRGREMAMMNELGKNFFGRISEDLEAQKVGPLIEEKEVRGRPFWSKVYYVKSS